MKLNLYCFNSWWKNYGDYDDDGDDDDDDDDDDGDDDDGDDDLYLRWHLIAHNMKMSYYITTKGGTSTESIVLTL